MEQTIKMTNLLKSKNLINSIGIALAIVIAIGAGYYLGTFKQGQAVKIAKDQTVKEIFSGALMINNLSGKILTVDPDKKFITVQIPKASFANLPQDYQVKTLLISSSTEIISSRQKSAGEFQKEIFESRVKLKGNPLNFASPLPVAIKELKVDDLKPDIQINFTFNVSDGKNILDRELSALQITTLDLEL